MQYARDAAKEAGRPKVTSAAGVEPKAARAELAHILASAAFDASERNRRFLRYVVEQTLAGCGDRIKAYDIAVTVFGRDDSFDPQSDPIVRIEASRLRRSLERYYLLAGGDDPIRIEIPKGGYVPVFLLQRENERSPAPEQRRAARPGEDVCGSGEEVAPRADGLPPQREGTSWRRPFIQQTLPRPVMGGLLALFVVLAGLGASSLGWQPWAGGGQPPASAPTESRPALMVAPFEDLSSEPRDQFAEGVAQEVLSNLIRFKEFVVFDARTSFQAAQEDSLELGRRLGADYVVTGSVRRDAGRVRVSSELVKLATGASIWTATYDEELAVDRLFEIQDGIAASVAATVAQPYGVVYRDARNQLQRHPPKSLSAYECLLQAYAYRRRLAPEPHAVARSCLEEAVVREPDYADALAMLAMVYVDEYRWGFNPRPDQYDPLGTALEMAQRAVDTAPDDALAWLALFETNFFRGDLELAITAGEQAISLNPNNPELRALVGMRLAHAGQWERGVGMLESALTMNPAPPGWYYFGLSVNELRQRDDEAALDWAEKIDMPEFFWTHALLAAIYGQLDRPDDASGAARRLLELYPDFESRALIELSRQHFEPAVLSRIVDGLRKAGLKIPEPPGTARKLG